MSEILLSLVVVTHHRPKLLEKCLQAIEQQTMNKSEFEVIVVDNNSTDKTANVIYTFLHRNPHFIYYRETNNGFNYARNRGLKLAKGHYVGFIEDEVILPPDWCKTVVDTFQTISPTPTVLTGNVQIWHDELLPSWFVTNLEERKLLPSAEIVEKSPAIIRNMDTHFVVYLAEFEKKSELKLTFHIDQKYKSKIQYRGKASEDIYFVQEHLNASQVIAYQPELIASQHVNPKTFSFKQRRLHSYTQGLTSEQEVAFASFSLRLIYVVLQAPSLLIAYPLHWLFPRRENFMSFIQLFSKNLGFLRKAFIRKHDADDELVSST